MKILIIRHADPDYALDSLTEKGFREANFLAQYLKDIAIDDFYCSPLGRARATAAPTLEAHGKSAEILDWLEEFRGRITSPFTNKERIAWDIAPSIICSDKRYYDINECYTPDLFAKGNSKAIYEETAKGIDKLLEKYSWKRHGMGYIGGEDKTIALFCHLGLGMIVVAYLLGISPVVAQNNFFLAPTSVTTLVTETDMTGFSHFRAVAVGDTSHLCIAKEPMSLSGLHPNFNK